MPNHRSGIELIYEVSLSPSLLMYIDICDRDCESNLDAGPWCIDVRPLWEPHDVVAYPFSFDIYITTLPSFKSHPTFHLKFLHRTSFQATAYTDRDRNAVTLK